MFALSDPERVRAILTESGWREMHVTPASTVASVRTALACMRDPTVCSWARPCG
jgi:hypothetical protein